MKTPAWWCRAGAFRSTREGTLRHRARSLMAKPRPGSWPARALILRGVKPLGGLAALTGVAATGAVGTVGLVVSLALTGVAHKMLFGLTPTDPTVFVVAPSVLAVTALLAGWLPARRASRVDPLVALRHE